MEFLVSIARGDAYGACFEYCPPSPGRPNDLSGYPRNDAYSAIGGGRYTDDTQMSIAVAETLIAASITREAFADRFVAAFRRDHRPGYSRTMQAFIGSCKDGTDFLARIVPHSDRSGAAMRAGAIGFLPDERDVLEVAALQARITHDTPGGVASAQASALMCHALRTGSSDRASLPSYLAARVPGPWTDPWNGPVGSSGMDSTRAALWALVSQDSASSILRASIAWGGDVDTVAAIAMGAAACDESVVQDLPRSITQGLEDGEWGRGFLDGLDMQLESVFPFAPTRHSAAP